MKDIKAKFKKILEENRQNPHLSTVMKEKVCDIAKDTIQNIKSEDEKIKILYETFKEMLDELKKNNLSNINTTSSTISAIVEALTFDQKRELYKLINEKEMIEQKIDDQKENVKKSIIKAFETIEEKAQNEKEQNLINSALNDVKLKSLDLLGILKETTQEAILGTVEKGDDIEESIKEIVKNIVYESINEGKLTKTRIAYILKTVIDASVEIADEDQAFAKEILRGTVYGSKSGISRAIGKCKNELKLIPNEVQKEIAKELEKTRNELANIDEDFINILKQSALSSKGISKKILNEIILKLNNAIEKLKRRSVETREAIADKINEITKESVFENEITTKAVNEAKQLSQDAKKVGKYLLDITKGLLNGAIKGAKDAMKKE